MPLIGRTDHLTGISTGQAPGASGEPSRVDQGLGIPKTGRVPRSVSGTRSYGIRHPTVKAVPAINTKVASDDGALPKIPKAARIPKLKNQL